MNLWNKEVRYDSSASVRRSHRSSSWDGRSRRGVNFSVWLAGRLKGAPAHKSISRLHACCWCAGFCNRRLSKAAHSCAPSKPILGLKSVAVFHDVDHFWPEGQFALLIRLVVWFSVAVPESPWAKYTGRVLTAVDVAKCTLHKDLRVGNNSIFFFWFIFVHSTETHNYTLTFGQRHTSRKCTYDTHSHWLV